MKAFCDNCDRMQPASYRPSVDAKTGEPFHDLSCDVCQFVVATVEIEPGENVFATSTNQG